MSGRAGIVLVTFLVCAGFAVVWLYLTLASAFACSPEVGPLAADSMRGRLCDARDSGPLFLLWVAGVVLAPMLVIAGAIVGVARHAWRPLAVFAGGGVVLLALVTIPFLALPSQ